MEFNSCSAAVTATYTFRKVDPPLDNMIYYSNDIFQSYLLMYLLKIYSKSTYKTVGRVKGKSEGLSVMFLFFKLSPCDCITTGLDHDWLPSLKNQDSMRNLNYLIGKSLSLANQDPLLQ